MQAHFKHLNFKSFPLVKLTFQSNEFRPLKSPSESSEVHRESNSQSGNSCVSVRVHFLTLSYTPGNMKCDSRVSFLTRTFASPFFGCKPKTRVATWTVTILWWINDSGTCHDWIKCKTWKHTSNLTTLIWLGLLMFFRVIRRLWLLVCQTNNV